MSSKITGIILKYFILHIYLFLLQFCLAKGKKCFPNCRVPTADSYSDIMMTSTFYTCHVEHYCRQSFQSMQLLCCT